MSDAHWEACDSVLSIGLNRVHLGETETMRNITIENKTIKQQRIKVLHPGPAFGFQLVAIQFINDE